MQQVYGHRGASGYAPENTLEAFELAAKMGAAGVELDVHLTSDGELVVTHDEKIDRVSTGTGYVMEHTLKALKALKFNKTHPEYANATIPTLREVFELLLPTGLCVNVELKNSEIFYPKLEEKCMALAAELGMTQRVLYSSFNHYSIHHIKTIAPEIPCGLLYDATLYRPWDYAQALKADALHPMYTELLISDECQSAHALGLEVNPWTVNEEKDLRMVFKAGADRVITNYPDRALSILKELGGGKA